MKVLTLIVFTIACAIQVPQDISVPPPPECRNYVEDDWFLVRGNIEDSRSQRIPAGVIPYWEPLVEAKYRDWTDGLIVNKKDGTAFTLQIRSYIQNVGYELAVVPSTDRTLWFTKEGGSCIFVNSDKVLKGNRYIFALVPKRQVETLLSWIWPY